MYASPYRTDLGYTGLLDFADRCPICDALNGCADAAAVAMPYPPIDVENSPHTVTGGPLLRYAVTVAGYRTVMRLNTSDAARYGDAAVLFP